MYIYITWTKFHITFPEMHLTWSSTNVCAFYGDHIGDSDWLRLFRLLFQHDCS